MGWLDDLLGTGGAPTGDRVAGLTPAQVQWFAARGINPNTLTAQQFFLAQQQMNTDLATTGDQAAAAERAAQEAAARAAAEAEAAAALAARQQQEEQQRLQAEAEARDAATRADAERQARDAAEAQRLQAEQEAGRLAAEEANRQRLAGLRSSAMETGRTGARDYFTKRGVDATPYGTDIDALITAALSGVPETSENPSSFIDPIGIGSTVYGGAETARRTSLLNALGQMFPDTYANTRVASTADDPIIEAIFGEQRGKANSLIDNMFKRGVITSTGADAARSSLDTQDPSVRTRLNTIGEDYLGTGRQRLSDVANRGRQTAQTISLGGAFNPDDYTREADQVFNDFMSSLPDTIRARTPGNLYQTNALASVAGSAQGAQNTKFNPNALAGVLEEQTEEDKAAQNKTKSSLIDSYVF